jgi:putative aldouronate transport system substrate-binding protein
MLLATGKLPDIVTYDMISPERETMEKEGMLYPLDDLVKEHAPDMVVSKDMMDWYRNKDGHWYAYTSFFYGKDKIDENNGWLTSHNTNFARKDIMDALGIKPESMVSKQGFIDALQKVKDAKYQYNGKLVEPYFTDVKRALPELAEQMGLGLEDKEGNLLNAYRQPEYLEALLFLNEIYTKKLMTDEVFTADNTIIDQKIANGEVFASSNNIVTSKRNDLFAADKNAVTVALEYLKGDAGKEPLIRPTSTLGWTGTMISKNSKHPDRAVQLLSFFSQEDVILAATFQGLDGYEIIDGKVQRKADRKAEFESDPQGAQTKYGMNMAQFMTDWTIIQKYEPLKSKQEADIQEYQNTIKQQMVNKYVYDDKAYTDVSPEGGTDLAVVDKALKDYWTQQMPKIIMAANKDAATQVYNETIQQMDTMGMKDIDSYKNERFQENKKKLGL